MHTLEQNIGNKKIHPHKFAMWMAIGSMIMLFAGFTSAYLVHMSKGNWVYFNVPTAFWYSTGAILLSSYTLTRAKVAVENGHLQKYRRWLTITTLLGLVFIALQYMGFQQLSSENHFVSGSPSESLFYIIPLVHGVHVLGGIVALIILTLRSYIKKGSFYSSVPVQVVGTYWHFVDFLWVYLFIFFILTQQLKVF